MKKTLPCVCCGNDINFYHVDIKLRCPYCRTLQALARDDKCYYVREIYNIYNDKKKIL